MAIEETKFTFVVQLGEGSYLAPCDRVGELLEAQDYELAIVAAQKAAKYGGTVCMVKVESTPLTRELVDKAIDHQSKPDEPEDLTEE